MFIDAGNYNKERYLLLTNYKTFEKDERLNTRELIYNTLYFILILVYLFVLQFSNI